MNMHEYQAKARFAAHGVPILPGRLCQSVAEVLAAAEEFASPVVVKSQIHAGGRGRGRIFADSACTQPLDRAGIERAQDPAEAARCAEQILGGWLRTAQTAHMAKRVHAVYVEPVVEVQQELYCSIIVDRFQACPMLLLAAQGGTEIEELASADPDAVQRFPVDPGQGLAAYQARVLGFRLGLASRLIPAFVSCMQALLRVFLEEDCELLEVNPLVITADDRILAIDAKMVIDGNALFRHPQLRESYDTREDDPAEIEARAHHLSFIKLQGNIGCLVNGAGLAMATMDAIALYGKSWMAAPANFLDVGGGANAAQVAQAFRLIVQDPGVEAILVNIFGGIMQCDVIAQGVIDALKSMPLTRPLVVRLEGSRVEEGRRMLADSGIPILLASDLADACEQAARAAVAWREGHWQQGGDADGSTG